MTKRKRMVNCGEKSIEKSSRVESTSPPGTCPFPPKSSTPTPRSSELRYKLAVTLQTQTNILQTLYLCSLDLMVIKQDDFEDLPRYIINELILLYTQPTFPFSVIRPHRRLSRIFEHLIRSPFRHFAAAYIG